MSKTVNLVGIGFLTFAASLVALGVLGTLILNGELSMSSATERVIVVAITLAPIIAVAARTGHKHRSWASLSWVFLGGALCYGLLCAYLFFIF